MSNICYEEPFKQIQKDSHDGKIVFLRRKKLQFLRYNLFTNE
jgi:hypothetical protein